MQIIKKMGKKANMLDPFFVAIMLFVTIITLLFVFVVWSNISPSLTNAINESSNNDPEIMASMENTTSNLTGALVLFDKVMPFLLMGLALMVFISAFFIKSSPIFFFVSLFLLLVFILISTILANTYQEIVSTEGIEEFAASYSISTMMMHYLPHIIVAIFFIAAIFLFAKPMRGEPPGGSI